MVLQHDCKHVCRAETNLLFGLCLSMAHGSGHGAGASSRQTLSEIFWACSEGQIPRISINLGGLGFKRTAKVSGHAVRRENLFHIDDDCSRG